MSAERVDCVVVGAGVVGLACARALAQAGREVIVVEAENAFGTATSARNSEVIHAGIYYPTGSLRALLCVRGKALLYDYCASHHVSHRRCGKLIVAQNDAEVAQLQVIEQRATANGVPDLQWLTRDEALALEPQLHCTARAAVALHRHRRQPRADAGAARRRAGRRRDAGAAVAGAARGRARRRASSSTWAATSAMHLLADAVVNSAGHGAPVLARATRGLRPQHVPPRYFAKGNYFTLGGRSPFSRLVYPAPGESSHLGVHLTLDLGGQAKFGPSFRWVDRLDYARRRTRGRTFLRRGAPLLAGPARRRAAAGLRRRAAEDPRPRRAGAGLSHRRARPRTACRAW